MEKCLRRFCAGYFKYFYAGRTERLELCRSTVAPLLDVVDNVRTCGPAWSFCEFPVERLISTLTPLIQSRRFSYASLVNALTHKYRADAVTRWAKTFVPADWEEATGKPNEDKERDPRDPTRSRMAKIQGQCYCHPRPDPVIWLGQRFSA